MTHTPPKKQNNTWFRPYLLLLISFFCIHWYQVGNSPTTIQGLNDKIEKAKHLFSTQPKQAITIIENTYRDAQQLPQDVLLAEIYHNIGRFQSDLVHDFPQALIAYQKGLHIREQYLDSLHYDCIRSLIMVGTTYRDLQNFDKAQIYLEKALIRHDKNPEPKQFLRTIALNLGSVYRATRQVDKAFFLLEKSKNLMMTDTADKARFFNSLGICYMQSKRYYLAIDNYLTAVKIANLLKNPRNLSLNAGFYNNLSICYRDSGVPTQALNYINLAIKTLDSIPQKTKEDYRNQGNIYLERGNCYKSQKQFPEAERDYQRAVAILLQHQFIYSPYLSEAYIGLGDIATQQGNQTVALAQYHKAVGVLIPEFTHSPPLNTPSVSQPIYAPIEAILALEAKAKTLYTLRNRSPLYFAVARATYHLLDSVVMNLKDNYSDDGSKFDLITRSVSIYEKALSLARQANDTADILFYTDRTKALILREGLRDRSAKHFAGIPDAVLQQEQDLEIEIAYWHKQIGTAVTEAERRPFSDSLDNAKRRLENFVDNDLRKTPQYQQYYNFKYQKNAPLSINDIRSRLKDSMAVIEYFVGNDSIYTITVSRQQVAFGTIPVPTGFQDTFKLFRESFISDDTKTLEKRKHDFERLSPQFYNWLVEAPLSKINAQQQIRRLRIIPDGVLGYLPFSLLLEKDNSSWTGNDAYQPPFLINRYAISYDYSRELMFDSTRYNIIRQERQRKGDKGGKFGGFGIGYDDFTLGLMKIANKELLPLPNSPKEVKEISIKIGGDYFTDQSKWWGNNPLSKTDFLKKQKQYSFLHLSMHASMDDRDPLNSALIFSKRDTADDNLLTAGELYAYDFNHNDLTVLSACNTAAGTLHRGEGIMSMARAITFGGCPSLVATLWSVGDNDMHKFMPDFYSYLEQGMDKDLALQAAQKAYLSQNYSDPNHWAAPILVGNLNAVKLESKNYWSLILWAAAVIGLLLLLWYKKRQS